MTRTTRRNYSKEFKIEAAKLVCEQGFSCIEVARQLNVADQNISRWVTAYEQSLQTERLGERPRSELEAELRRLRAENEELKQQKDILKKATVDSIGQCNIHTKTWSSEGLMNETYIYSSGKRVCF